ncbi:hypothetical protein [Colwellia psychrerythraea]|uniref:CDP-glycerol:poly(Glycerophosphate) glycerophosphotransferase n=1 Tax=Colwellia psychrerythraea TaxID=28229 RepID=A0A099KKT4_COLPS|nr:hypothetical protein [Colwellia psychrerythraea]KGJ90885.1 CDP-glycerol:poly(glycerophosphate) glycerophosphotransferase [Colwellia psychrerythraea]
MKLLTQVLLVITFLYSEVAFAYLDPGSGSAIISVIIATIGSLWYFLKSLLYRVSGKNIEHASLVSQDNSLLIFSEGKAYWGTFGPLVAELIKEKIPFRYRTLDLHDPALTIESKYMQSKRLSLNPIHLAEFSKINAPVMIATSPNIGTQGYPIMKPAGVANLMHVFHHIGDISIYKRNSLDHYDSVILAGDFQKKSIRVLENLRNLKKKRLITLGLLYLDELYQNRLLVSANDREKETILIGSSWGPKGCLQTYGTAFITALVAAGFKVIIRPHPQSAITEPEFIEKCKRATISTLVTWDESVSPTRAMSEAKLLISDTSSLRFDYAFLYEKPIITLAIPKANLAEFEAVDLDYCWHESAAAEIGVTVDSDSLHNIVDIVNRVIKTHASAELQSFKRETIVNFGNCAPKVVSYIKKLNVNRER